MSTTSALQVAVQFSASEASVLLRLRTSSFMSRGADMSFLSVFPAENECLFPPLTYLKVFEKHDVAVGGAAFSLWWTCSQCFHENKILLAEPIRLGTDGEGPQVHRLLLLHFLK